MPTNLKKYNAMMTFAMSKETKKELYIIAKKLNLHVSEFIRLAIKNEITKNETNNK